MFRRMKSPRPIALSALLSLGIASSRASGDPPKNLQLIASMPAGAESVLIYRYGLLTGEDSVLRDDFVRVVDSLGQTHDTDARNKPLPIIFRHVAMATPVVHVEGGSEFTAADGVGLGNYNGRSIWITEKPLTALAKRLADRKDVKGDVKSLTLGAVQAFEFPVEVSISSVNPKTKPISETRFVAFPNDHTVVIAESRAELEEILKGIDDKAPKIPRQWETLVAGLDVEAPIVVLRRYDPKNDRDYFSPVNPKRPEYHRADVEGFGLVLSTVKHVVFRMKCVGNQADRAVAFYQADTFSGDVFNWETRIEPPGFTADIKAKDDRSPQLHIMLRLYILFGPNVFI